MIIRDAALEDASEIADIYNFYVVNTRTTFEERKVSEKEMSIRLKKSRRLRFAMACRCNR